MNKIFLLFLIFAFPTAVNAELSKQQSYNATFIDNMNVTTFVNNVQCKFEYLDTATKNESKYVIFGQRGKSTVTIPWEKIKRIDFLKERDNYNAAVGLKDGRRVLIYADLANVKYKGKNDFGGSFLINAEYVRAIIFN